MKSMICSIKNRIEDISYCHRYTTEKKKLEAYARTNPKKCCKYFYKLRMGKSLNLSNPMGLNERIQWLKIYEILPNLPLYTVCADKYLVREYLSNKGYSDLLVPLIGVYDSPDEIGWAYLPERFVLKANHGSGMNLIVKDKSKLDIQDVTNELQCWLDTEYWLAGGEWQYRDIPKKIICEAYIEPERVELVDYKFFCYRGNVKYLDVWVDHNAKGRPHYIYLDRNYNLVPFNEDTIEYINNGKTVFLPNNITEMINIAADLSKEFPFVRVDLYSENGKIYFGELTFTPCAGVDTNFTELGLAKLGEGIIIK